MNRVYRALWLVLAAMMLLIASPIAAQDNATARFVHVIPGASAIDVYLNGTLVLSDVSYGEATGYLTVPAGEHTVTVTASGISSTVLWEQSISTAADSATTFVASSPETLRFDAFNDNLSSTAFGSTRLLLIHALAGGPAVDITLAEPVTLNGALQDAGTALATDMAYATSFGAFDLPAQNYVVNVSITGTIDTLLSNLTLPLDASTSHMAIVYGTAQAPAVLVASSPTNADSESGLVRFVHAATEAPAVDVYVNDSLIAPSLEPATPTAHLALPAGEHSLMLRVAGTEDEVLSGNLTVNSGEAQTVVALPDAEGVQVQVVPDDVSGVTETTAAASIINALPDSSADIALSDGTSLGTVEFGATSSTATFDPGNYFVNYELTIGEDTGSLQTSSQTYYGGVYYNIILLPGGTFSPPELIVAPTVLSQGIASGPGMGETTIATGMMPQSTDNTATEEQPTAETAAEPTVEARVATPAPQTQASDVVTGRIVLDPGANLQLRQYPDADAFSLGLAPSGTVLTVLGREGAPVALVEGEEPPPEAEEFVDPATLLESEDDDLIPEETWLRVVYSTPDGGEIEAWVNALYLDVRDPDGDLQRLADLETVGNNIPGEARGTSVTPPPVPEDRVSAIIINLNPGVSLNIRRTPETTGEVLERLPNGTAMEFIGIISAADATEEATEEVEATATPEFTEADWVFVSYAPGGGGTITGWASMLYLRFEYNGRAIDLEEMTERGLLATVPADRRGSIQGGAQQASAPTPDPTRDAYVAEVNLDAGANLQFRLDPDAAAESLNLIPTGARLIISARTEAGDWLQTTYEGQTGWIASQFVVLSYNGQFVEVTEVPVATTPIPEGTPEATPENAG